MTQIIVYDVEFDKQLRRSSRRTQKLRNHPIRDFGTDVKCILSKDGIEAIPHRQMRCRHDIGFGITFRTQLHIDASLKKKMTKTDSKAAVMTA